MVFRSTTLAGCTRWDIARGISSLLADNRRRLPEPAIKERSFPVMERSNYALSVRMMQSAAAVFWVIVTSPRSTATNQ